MDGWKSRKPAFLFSLLSSLFLFSSLFRSSSIPPPPHPLSPPPIETLTGTSHSSFLVNPLPNSPNPVELIGAREASLETSNSTVRITPPNPSHRPLPSGCSHRWRPPPWMRDWVTPSFVVVVERRLCVVPAWLRMLLAVALRR